MKDKWIKRGRDDYRSGKPFDDNPYIRHPQVAKSSWWQSGYLNEKKRGEQHEYINSNRSNDWSDQ